MFPCVEFTGTGVEGEVALMSFEVVIKGGKNMWWARSRCLPQGKRWGSHLKRGVVKSLTVVGFMYLGMTSGSSDVSLEEFRKGLYPNGWRQA